MNLVVFITTKGHNRVPQELRYSLYKPTMQNLIKQSDGDLSNLFKNKILNLKMFNGDELRAKEYIEYFKNLGFEIILHENKDQSIDDQTIDSNRMKYMLGNYLNDLRQTYSLLTNFPEEHTFLYEDDCPIIVERSNLKYQLDKSENLLKSNKHIGSVVFARLVSMGRYVTPKFWYHATKLKNENGVVKNNGFNFQPGVRRTNELVNTANLITQHWNSFIHLEPEEFFGLAFEQANGIKNLDHFALPFEDIYSLHLGDRYGGTIENHKDNRIDYDENLGYILEKTRQPVEYNYGQNEWILK